MADIDNTQGIIDVRDIIEAFERESSDEDGDTELADTLDDLLSDLRGNGGDVQWRGDWYPITLIRYSYFEDYARELADDIGSVPDEWPGNCIDWERAAREAQMDYTSVDYDGISYWYR